MFEFKVTQSSPSKAITSALHLSEYNGHVTGFVAIFKPIDEGFSNDRDSYGYEAAYAHWPKKECKK